jgi:hypothetical protein
MRNGDIGRLFLSTAISSHSLVAYYRYCYATLCRRPCPRVLPEHGRSVRPALLTTIHHQLRRRGCVNFRCFVSRNVEDTFIPRSRSTRYAPTMQLCSATGHEHRYSLASSNDWSSVRASGSSDVSAASTVGRIGSGGVGAIGTGRCFVVPGLGSIGFA